MTTTRPVYEVVSPASRRLVEEVSSASAVSSLEGKTIGFIWTIFTNGDVLADAFMDLLGKRSRGLSPIRLPPGKGLEWGNYPDKSIGTVAKEAGVDAVVVTVGC